MNHSVQCLNGSRDHVRAVYTVLSICSNNNKTNKINNREEYDTMFAIFGEAKIPITEQTTVAEVKNLLSNLYPEITNYQSYIDDDGNMRFRPVGGTKGN